MLRSHIVAFFFISLLAPAYARAIPLPSPSANPIPLYSLDDHGEYFPPLPPDEQYYEDEGADGNSTGSVKLSIGAEAGIIVAIVLLGLAIMGSCLWFWMKKKNEWKAIGERKRALRTGHRAPSGQQSCSGGASPDMAGKTVEEKGVIGLGLTTKMSGLKWGKTHTLPAIAEKDLEREQGQLTPIKEEGPEWPWWKRALPRQT